MIHGLIERLTFLLICVLSIEYANSQKTIRTQGEIIKGKALYFIKEDNNDINFFTRQSGIDDKEDVRAQKVFALKGNYSNIYFKWLNPLKYKITWKDSTYVDDRDKAIRDLVSSVAGRFGLNTTEQNKAESRNILHSIKPSEAVTKAIDSGKKVALNIPENTGFNNFNLSDLYLQLRDKDNQGKLSNNEIDAINKLTPLLVELDGQILTGIAERVNDALQTLFEETDPANARTSLLNEKGNVKTNKAEFVAIENLQRDISSQLKALSISDALIYSSIKTRINRFLEESASSLIVDKKTISNFESILNTVEASLKEEAEMKGFFRVRNARFDDGSMLETAITISEYKIEGEPKTFKKDKDVSTSKLIFKKYDFFDISVSAGVFYSNTSMKSYGIAPGTNNDFTVTEDVINKSSAVTALFGNINFGTGSRYFSPLVQLGIDPTKKRPFFLLGGGFSIPAASFAISAGGVWTWDQTLNKLSVGQKIASSTDLEKDIKNNFDIVPKGWYLGIQYNF